MTIKKTLLFAALFPLFSAPIMAADEHGLYQTSHFISCENYAKNRKSPGGNTLNSLDAIYVSGWISSYNFLTPNTYDIIPNQNMDTVMKWLDDFCKSNPKLNIEIGLIKLTDDLYPQRIQLAPGTSVTVDPKAVNKTPVKK